MAFNLSSITPSGDKAMAGAAVSGGIVAEDDIDMMPPVYYETSMERIELRDAMDILIGYDDVTSGFGYTYTTHYDATLNYLGSDYVDDSGYRSSTRQTAEQDAGGNIVGYLVVSSGEGNGYSYSSRDEYDAQWNLLHSEYSDGAGYSAQTDQVAQYDGGGAITGYVITSAGGDVVSSYSSTASYDASWNLLESNYSDSSGYQSTYLQTPLLDANGKVTGYQIVSSGSGGWGGYASTEFLDADRNLISSDYSDDSGYRSTYAMAAQYDANGKVSGYVVSSTWSYGDETYSSENRYDAEWNWIDGSDPPMVFDDGPKILPVLALTDDEKAASAQADMGMGAGASNENTVTDTPGTVDTLWGSQQDDVFVISDRGDQVVGHGGKGEDSVLTGAFSLKLRGGYAGIENGGLLGSDDLDLTGNGKDNTLSGNTGDNRLAGKRGEDSLFGGLGSDIFYLDKYNLDATDTLIDFTIGTDYIGLNRKTFHDLAGEDGGFDEAAWGDRLRFDTDKGALIYDTGSGEVTIALIGGDMTGLGANSFIID